MVFQATCVPTGEVVAIKKVLQDRRFKVGISIQSFSFKFLKIGVSES